MRQRPNIIITGTPGTGKTVHATALAEATGLHHVAVNEVVKQHDCQDGYDDELDTIIVDEDKLLDALEDDLRDGGNIIDWHACDLFPESWIDLVVVLRTESRPLYDRLKARQYAETKLQNNVDAEIMQVLLNEAREAYAPEVVVELASNSTEDLNSNVERMQDWLAQWLKDQATKSTAG